MQTTDPTYPADEPDEDPEVHDQRWIDAVGTVASRAYERLPQHQDIIKRAFTLIADGQVEALVDGSYRVATGLKKGKKFWTINGTCECPEWHDTPDAICVHKMATMLWTRATQLLAHHRTAAPEPPPAPAPAAAPEPGTTAIHSRKIQPHWIVERQGKRFIRFIGLLVLAHEDGLISLAAEWTGNDPELSLAHAVAKFNDGRRFEESGDASPENVGAPIRPHFRRMALTRAKARVLRDALGIDLVAVEELAE